MIVISKAPVCETVKTANPIYEVIDSNENRLGTVDQQEENPSYGEKYVYTVVYISRLK